MPQIFVLALAVYFAWDALGRPAVAAATGRLPNVAQASARYAVVAGLSWGGYRYAPHALTEPLALGALVGFTEQLVAVLRHSSEREIQAVQVRRRGGGGPSRFPWP